MAVPTLSLFKIGDMARGERSRRLLFTGDTTDHSLIIGSHGNSTIKADGVFDLSGIVYSPKYRLTIFLNGNGHIALRGICHSVIIRRMNGHATLDLRELVCRELMCMSVKDNCTILAGRVRTVPEANLSGNAVLVLTEKPLILHSNASGHARVVFRANGTPDHTFEPAFSKNENLQ